MKTTRRMTAFTLVLTLLTLMLMPASAGAVTNESPYEIQNDEARWLYNSLVEASRIERAQTEELGLQTSSVTRSLEEETRFTGDFEVLSLAVGDEEDRQIIYADTDGSAYTVIEYNAATGTYALLEASAGNAEVLYMVDGEAFHLVMDGENVNMVSESGEILPLITVEYITAPSPEAMRTNMPGIACDLEALGDECSVLNTTEHNWSKAYGPYYRTNKQWCVILKIIKYAASAALLKIQHPVLGAIVLTMEIAQDIVENEDIYVTLYIKYYNYYDLNDMYWTRELQYWYQNSDYTQLLKTIDKITYDDSPW